MKHEIKHKIVASQINGHINLAVMEILVDSPSKNV